MIPREACRVCLGLACTVLALTAAAPQQSFHPRWHVSPPALDPTAVRLFGRHNNTAAQGVTAATDSSSLVISRRQLQAPALPANGKYTDLAIPSELNTGIDCDTSAGARYEGQVLTSGTGYKVSDVDHCRKACRDASECNAWTWCNDEQGCTTEDGSSIPRYGCQLKQEPRKPWGVPSRDHIILKPSTFASGYVKRPNLQQHTFKRQQLSPTTSLLVATSMRPAAQCQGSYAQASAQMALMSRQNYARWHSYELHISAANHASGYEWNQIAMVRQLLETTPAHVAEWILYMDSEAIFSDPAVEFPFEMYGGRDIILTGAAVGIMVDNVPNVDPGMMLIRNCARSRELFRKLDEMSGWQYHAPKGQQLKEAMARLLQENGHQWMKRIHHEGGLCLNCHWQEVDLELSSKTTVTKEWGAGNKKRNLFVVRFFGCDMCGAQEGDMDACYRGWLEHYQWGYCRLHRLAKMADREQEQGVPLQLLHKIVNVNGFDVDTWKHAQRKPNQVLSASTVSNSQACYSKCLEDSECSFWVWCNQKSGCDEGGLFDGSFPDQSCTLMQIPTGVSPYEWSRGPEASSFASGYQTAGSRGQHHARTSDRIVTLSGIPTQPCTLPWGDHFVSLATQNKQDWARLHGYEFHVMAASCDVRIRPGPWQKIAMIRQALDTIPRERAEWVLWIDMDIILGDITFTFPLDKVNYTDRDIITWGGKRAILAGDAYNGINTGVMLVRNTDFSRHVMDLTLHFGQFPVNMSTEQVLKENLPTYDIGMLEQMSMVYVLKQNPDYIPRLYFEHGYCFNCWYQDLDDPRIHHPAFVIHFAGCKMCAGLHVDKLGLCDSIFIRSYAESFAQLLWAAPARGL